MYGPAIQTADILEEITKETFTAKLFGNIKAMGTIEYLYVLVVYPLGETKPSTFITAEVNMMAEAFGGGSHFLCAFATERHLNFGSDDKWADLETFREKSLSMAADFVKKGEM